MFLLKLYFKATYKTLLFQIIGTSMQNVLYIQNKIKKRSQIKVWAHKKKPKTLLHQCFWLFVCTFYIQLFMQLFTKPVIVLVKAHVDDYNQPNIPA